MSADKVQLQNAAATRAACARYKARNTGNQQWDKCPDCVAVSLP